MTTNFTLATKTKVDSFRDSASIDDVVKYSIDCTPWQEDNDTITGATWTVDGNSSASISNQQLSSGVITAFVTFAQAGVQRIRITLTTATRTKVLWLETSVKDLSRSSAGDDYEYGS